MPITQLKCTNALKDLKSTIHSCYQNSKREIEKNFLNLKKASKKNTQLTD